MRPDVKTLIEQFDAKEKALILAKHDADPSRPTQDILDETRGETHDEYLRILSSADSRCTQVVQ